MELFRKKSIESIKIVLPVIAIIGIGAVSTLRGSDVLGLFAALVVFLAMVVLTNKIDDFYLKYTLFLAFFVRIMLLLIQAFIIPLPDSTADAMMFENTGWEVAEALEQGAVLPDNGLAFIYSKFIGYLYFLFGRVAIIPQLINVILGVLIVFYIYRLVLELGASRKAARVGAFIASIFPTMMLYSAITLRETIITFFALLSVLFFIRWINNCNRRSIILALVSLVICTSFHAGMIFIGVALGVVYCFYNPETKKFRLIRKELIISVTLFIVFFALFKNKLIEKLPSNLALLFSADYLTVRLKALPIGRTMYLVDLYPSSIFEAIIQTPLRILYFMFSPFPWMVKSIGDAVALLDAVLYVILTLFAFRGYRRLQKINIAGALVIVLVLIFELGVFAWGVSNVGSAMRHRQKLAPLIISVAAVGAITGDRKRSGLET